MRRLLPSLLVLWAFGPLVPTAFAAAYAPAATAAVDWTPNTTGGVGVPGGIPARATIHTTITTTGDTTDRRAEIEAALIACPAGQTVLLGPGEFWISYTTLNGGHLNGKTLRGSGSNPATGTVIKIAVGGVLLLRGGEFYNTLNVGDVTGSPTKGATTLSGTNINTDMVGRVVKLTQADDLTLPTGQFSIPYASTAQYVLVTAVNTGAGTFTFQPALYRTPVQRFGSTLPLGMKWTAQHGNGTLSGAGIEDLVIDNTTGAAQSTLIMSGAHGSWVKNVRLVAPRNYGLNVQEATQCEFRQVYVGECADNPWIVGSHAGMTIGGISACLFEDNIILKNFPLIEAQGAPISGNVFGYNFAYQYANVVCVSFSHNTGNHNNLWEGNSFSGIVTDGYFGGAADDVIYRNDLHGLIKDSAIPHYPAHLCRMTRFFELVGNQMGRSGTTLNIESTHPTAFNGSTNGVANNLTGDPHVDLSLFGTLTTRTSDHAGVVTLSTTLGSVADTSPTHFFIAWGANYETYRAGLTVISTNSGALTCTFGDGGFGVGYGTVLPAEGTAVQVSPGANGYRERDDGVAYSLFLLGNYYYSDGQIPAPQALGTTTLPASLYRATPPAFMSGYTWPPYDPVTRNESFGAIPAGARYIAELGPGTPTHAPGPLRAGMRRR